MEIHVDPKLELDEESALVLEAENGEEGYLVTVPGRAAARPAGNALPPGLAVRGVQAVARVLTALGNLWIAFFRELARVFVGAGQSLERSAGHGDPVVDIISLLLMYLLFVLVIACTAMTWVPPLLRWGLTALLWVIGGLFFVVHTAARGLVWLLRNVVFPVVRLAGRVLLHVPFLGSYVRVLRHGRPASRVAAVALLVLASGVWFLSASAPTRLGPGVHDSWADAQGWARERLEWDRVEDTFHRVVREIDDWLLWTERKWEEMTGSSQGAGTSSVQTKGGTIMKWQDLLKRRPEKKATIESGQQPRVVVEQPADPAFGRQGFLVDRDSKPVEQPVEVEMKDQVMG